ncbi:MAG: porphobilinogen synthase [Anaerolineae bacterium]
MSLFPTYRPRRMRINQNLRRMVRETSLTVDDLIYPLFVRHGQGVKQEISSMPGNYQWSLDRLPAEAEEIAALGIPAVILFGLPAEKDPWGSEDYDPHGIVQEAVRAIKGAVPELVVITDVCMCEYTDHGHCGIVKGRGNREVGRGLPEGYVLNDETLEYLGRVALSHAEAGADMVAPSGMIDGMVGAIREALDGEGFTGVSILSYAAKYASSFYGPFREAAESPPQFGDRRAYQMDPANAREALREVFLDIGEGADIIMVKPALPYLDIIRLVRDHFDYPVAAYNVSGEYAMVKAAAAKGWIDGQMVTMELLTGIKRAGADLILTYHAKEVAGWLTCTEPSRSKGS